MKRRLTQFACTFLLLWAWGTPPAIAQSSSAEAAPAIPAEPVRFRDRELFRVTSPLGELNTRQRADAIERRLLGIADGPSEALRNLRVVEREGGSELYAGDRLIRIVTDADAAGTGRTRRQVAADQLAAVREALVVEFADRTSTALTRSILKAIAATALLVAAVIGMLRLYRWAYERATRAAQRWRSTRPAGSVRWMSWQTLSDSVRRLVAIGAWVLGLTVFYIYLEYVLSLFPWTRGIAASLVGMGESAVQGVVRGFVDYLPNLFNIVAIVLAARIAMLALRKVFDNIAAGRVHLTGFFPDWAQPTYSLLRFFVIAIGAVMIFPYLPGSGSEGFKGVSVFIGLLLSLGAATAIGNVIAGVVITYMRPFRVGDRVKIADAVGDIINKDLFVVRLRTIKNVDITVPNSLVLSNHIVNYTTGAEVDGLILHTSVSIGYDTAWEKVHEALIAAAGKVEGLERDPPPFVLQTKLDDFYVCYELNVRTREPARMADLYSRLHAQIQDEFAARNIEILSPHYTSVRDGARRGIPDEYLPKDYRAPAFRFWSTPQPKSE
jgi:small-conductance mechanosensitive channel